MFLFFELLLCFLGSGGILHAGLALGASLVYGSSLQYTSAWSSMRVKVMGTMSGHSPSDSYAEV